MKQPDRNLVAALDPFMTAHGFKYIGKHGGYYRKYSGGFDLFSWGSYPLYTGDKWAAGYYEGHYGLGIRIDAIEALTREVMPIYGAEFQRYAFTVYRGVGAVGSRFSFDPARDRELFLRFDRLEEDVTKTVGRIEAMLESDGWAWYRRYVDPAVLSRDINDPMGGIEPHPLMNNVNLRPLVGIAAACVGEPDRVPELVADWLAALKQWDQQCADQRSPEAPNVARKFDLIIAKAREIGIAVPICKELKEFRGQ